MYKIVFLAVILTILIGCHPKPHLSQSKSYNGIPIINFCDLPAHEGKLVYTKAIYSGIDEYWALNSEKKCKRRINVELDDKEGTSIPEKYQSLFNAASMSYWNTYLSIEMTGVYESKNLSGYGHLGSNKARFIIKDYINVKLVRREEN